MKHHRRTRTFMFLIIALLCILWNVPYTTRAQTAIQVTTTADVNLRAEPRTNAKVIAVIPAGTTLTASGRNAATSFIQVTSGNSTGWVSARFLSTTGDLKTLPIVENAPTPVPVTGGGGTPGGAVTGTVSSSGLSVRQQPSATGKKLGLLPGGTVVTLTGRQGSGNSLWVQFSYQGQNAWLAGWLLKISGDINSLPVVAPSAPPPTPAGADAGGQPAKGQAKLIFVNQLATTLHIKAEGPTPIDVNMGPNSTLSFDVAPGTYHLSASAQDRVEVGDDVTIGPGQQFTWYLHG